MLIESLFKCFFWCGEEIRKINWIKYDVVCLDKEVGGVEVRRMREFNISLLDKWFKVLGGKYGMKRVEREKKGA